MQVSHNYAVDALAVLERTPGAVAMSSASSAVTNVEIATLVRRFAAQMMARGINSRSCVVIAHGHGPTAFLAAFAAGLIGACWVVYHPRLPFRALGTTHFLHGRDKPAGVAHPGMHEIDDRWSVGQAHAPGRLAGFVSPDSPALVTRSSGTTGAPKFMMRTCGQVAYSLRRDDLSSYRAVSTLFPLTSLLGFHLAMRAILHGARIVRPTNLAGGAAALQRMGVDYVHGSPAQVDALCQGPAPASRLGTLWVVGSIMSLQAVRHWLGYFDKVELKYGAGEIGIGGSIALTDIGDRTEIAYTLLPGIRAEITGGDGTPLSHSVAGIVRLRAPAMVPAYIGEPEATAEMFRDGWFYPGDIGMLTPDGRLRILGRIKDQFNLGGIKFNAADIDMAARSVPGIRDAMCFTTQSATGLQRLSLCAVKDADGNAMAAAAAIRTACRTMVRRQIELAAIYFVDALPRNETGKAVRGEGARMVMDLSAF